MDDVELRELRYFIAAWPGTSRSRAVAAFVRAAIEVAASHAEQPTALT